MTDPVLGYHPRAVLLVHALGRPISRATSIGLVAGTVAGAVVGFRLVEQAPWPLMVGAVVAATVLVGLPVAIVLIPTQIRRAFSAFSWLGHREVRRFRERTGSKPPTSYHQVVMW